MFFQIKEERFKMSSVSRYSSSGRRSTATGKWYVTVHFGQKTREFAFDTSGECDNVLMYLDAIFKVQVV